MPVTVTGASVLPSGDSVDVLCAQPDTEAASINAPNGSNTCSEAVVGKGCAKVASKLGSAPDGKTGFQEMAWLGSGQFFQNASWLAGCINSAAIVDQMRIIRVKTAVMPYVILNTPQTKTGPAWSRW